MKLFERLTAKAQEHPQRLVLPESTEPRTLKAADRIIRDGIAQVTFIGKKDEILAKATELGLTNIGKATIVDGDNKDFTEKYAELLCELRKKKA